MVQPLKIPYSVPNEVHAGEEKCYHCGGVSQWYDNCDKQRSREPQTALHCNGWQMAIPGRKLYLTNILWPNAKIFNQPSSASLAIVDSSAGGWFQKGGFKAVDEK